jgi:hypothetical protein
VRLGEVADGDVGTVGGELEREAATDPARGAGDERDPAVEPTWPGRGEHEASVCGCLLFE